MVEAAIPGGILAAAAAAAWCETACKEPVKPSEMTRTVTSQKLVGGRLTTVESEVTTTEALKYESDLKAWQALAGPSGGGGCAARCTCGVLGTQKTREALTSLTSAALVQAMARGKPGPDTWQACACRRSPDCATHGRCTARDGRCDGGTQAH